MSDLISRQAAIKWCRPEEWGTPDERWRPESEFGAMLEALPSAQQEQQWIPVSERLPNTNGVYNVTRKISDGFECKNISDTCYYDGTNTWHDDTRVNHERRHLTDVIAWMPLPEPYKEERE